MAIATYPVQELRNALRIKRKTGITPVYAGWTLHGQVIETIVFEPFDRVQYIGNNGEIIGVFQSFAALDD